jgi:TorA maturation chaperone TorD
MEAKGVYDIGCKNFDYLFLCDTILSALPYKSVYILMSDNVDVKN